MLKIFVFILCHLIINNKYIDLFFNSLCYIRPNANGIGFILQEIACVSNFKNKYYTNFFTANAVLVLIFFLTLK